VIEEGGSTAERFIEIKREGETKRVEREWRESEEENLE
jgi:hypothetical protein